MAEGRANKDEVYYSSIVHIAGRITKHNLEQPKELGAISSNVTVWLRMYDGYDSVPKIF